MPQMNPMSWLVLFFLFSIMLIVTISVLHFSPSIKIPVEKTAHTLTSDTWLW